jgi:hypothetical protein
VKSSSLADGLEPCRTLVIRESSVELTVLPVTLAEAQNEFLTLVNFDGSRMKNYGGSYLISFKAANVTGQTGGDGTLLRCPVAIMC